jgi:hypothetical protein
LIVEEEWFYPLFIRLHVLRIWCEVKGIGRLVKPQAMAGTKGGWSRPVTAEEREICYFPAKLSKLVFSDLSDYGKERIREGLYYRGVNITMLGNVGCSYLVALCLYLFVSSYFASDALDVLHENRDGPRPPIDERNILQDQTGDADSFSEIGRTIILDAFAT